MIYLSMQSPITTEVPPYSNSATMKAEIIGVIREHCIPKDVTQTIKDITDQIEQILARYGAAGAGKDPERGGMNFFKMTNSYHQSNSYYLSQA